MTSTLLYEVRGTTAWITLNRPEAHNALTAEMRSALTEAYISAENDGDVRVIVLTAAGRKAFCTGGDLKETAANRMQVPPPGYIPQPSRTLSISKPIIAAVNGLAFAGGFLLAQTADLVVASSDAQFAISEPKVGRGAPWAAPLPWLIPPRIAVEMLLTAQPITAQRAMEVGLVNRVVDPDDLSAAAQELADSIVANAPMSVLAAKKMIYEVAEHGRTDAFAVAERIWEPVYLSDDAMEGTQAFVERRRPEWQGR